MQPRNKFSLAVLLAATSAATLGGCSEYLDRRDGVSLVSGNAVATNKIVQMVDPWPPESANRNIAFNGQRSQAAVERYRFNKVIQPRSIQTSGSFGQGGGGGDAGASSTPAPVGQTVTQSAAPTK